VTNQSDSLTGPTASAVAPTIADILDSPTQAERA